MDEKELCYKVPFRNDDKTPNIVKAIECLNIKISTNEEIKTLWGQNISYITFKMV